MKHEPLVIERVYKAPVEKVWKAITDKEQMKEWYFDVSDFKPEVGFEFTFTGENEGRVFLHLCKVLEVIPLRKLTYSWRYEGKEGISYLTFELFPEGDETRLKLTHEGLETFPQDRDFRRENFVEGWTYITRISLSDFLEKTKIRKQIEIDAPASSIWQVLVDDKSNRQWANEFSEGAYAESTWQKDSVVIWKDKDGVVGTKGKVVICDKPNQLKVQFYDDVNADDKAPLGTYFENYTIISKGEGSLLFVESGPLEQKDADMFSPLWDKALAKMKALAEAPTYADNINQMK
jgi:uncharacterized protein YndB with AHSA1/START domain